ncbi:Hypothetical protein R9X50_00518100 [Acrodontium crateriforme]|uniref:CCCH zinc finger and SMR domain containing protein n=1 Tax=Acrodontium crateriforme TaxID=150365 RepID=A0AAQ3M8W2_9PEZI|nr:Hypothetical protein R9X50_00518100 [Acrodontium crateriforme]
MLSDRIYDKCRPILENDDLGEEEKTDQLEELLSTGDEALKGKALEDAVLGALWQWKSITENKHTPPPSRAVPIRSRSPAPWLQRTGTPGSGGNSPRPSTSGLSHPPGFGSPAYALSRTKSSTVSPFGSPRPSPRLPVATPAIPHSPRLSAYQFSESSPTTDNYGDYGSDTVDWLVNDDASSTTSFSDLNATADYMAPYMNDMSPYDMLRSILQHHKTDEELDKVLEANGYDLSQTINALMEAQGMGADVMAAAIQEQQKTILVGKSMSPSSRPITPAGHQKSPIVCRYWLASGHCARADCRYAHEVQNHVCKFWLQGHCLAGNSCLFSHDPAALVQQLNINGSGAGTPQQMMNYAAADLDGFTPLRPTTSNPYEEDSSIDPATLNAVMLQQQQLLGQQHPGVFPFIPGQRLNSRPGSRPESGYGTRSSTPSQPNFQDDEAFPTLGSAASKPAGKRHHGKRGGHAHNVGSALGVPSNLGLSSSPNSREAMRRGLRNNRSFNVSTTTITAPLILPWLETGNANSSYMQLRQEAFKHGGARNRFLQSAAQAWNRNDARGAKALSTRGQNENSAMREKHHEAARVLYEERAPGIADDDGRQKEIYIDLHGLHAEEAVAFLEECIRDQKSRQTEKASSSTDGTTPPAIAVYAICGSGHHGKNAGKDKIGKAVRHALAEWGCIYREFQVTSDQSQQRPASSSANQQQPSVTGVLGIDPLTFTGGDAASAVTKKIPMVIRDDGEDSGVGLDGTVPAEKLVDKDK